MAISVVDLQPDPPVFALRPDPHVLPVRSLEELRVPVVQLFNHPLDCRFVQFTQLDFVHEVAVDPRHDFFEQPSLEVDVRPETDVPLEEPATARHRQNDDQGWNDR